MLGRYQGSPMHIVYPYRSYGYIETPEQIREGILRKSKKSKRSKPSKSKVKRDKKDKSKRKLTLLEELLAEYPVVPIRHQVSKSKNNKLTTKRHKRKNGSVTRVFAPDGTMISKKQGCKRVKK
ncbi:MAG: hypothetical protein Q4C83_00935 [Candidatus Saccharibacteria bacterium]|nr:hypothetical protein [Candidatus Saccharibacteria bacterium]